MPGEPRKESVTVLAADGPEAAAPAAPHQLHVTGVQQRSQKTQKRKDGRVKGKGKRTVLTVGPPIRSCLINVG